MTKNVTAVIKGRSLDDKKWQGIAVLCEVVVVLNNNK